MTQALPSASLVPVSLLPLLLLPLLLLLLHCCCAPAASPRQWRQHTCLVSCILLFTFRHDGDNKALGYDVA